MMAPELPASVHPKVRTQVDHDYTKINEVIDG